MLDGFVPREIHEHFNDADERTGYTVVHRETEWDEATRDRVVRAQEYEQSICSCGCGQPKEIAWDPTFEPWEVDDFTCYARKALETVRRAFEESHRDSMAGASDGVYHFVAPAEGAQTHPERAGMTKTQRAAASAEQRKSQRMTRRTHGD